MLHYIDKVAAVCRILVPASSAMATVTADAALKDFRTTMDAPYAPNLSVGHIFSRSWEAFRERMGLTVAVFLIYVLLTGSASIFDSDGWFGGLGNVIMFVIAGPITVGTYAFALERIRGEPADIGDMFTGFQEFGRAFGVFAIYMILVAVGMVFLIVPGIYIAVALAPALFLVMQDRLGVTDTLRKAWSMTEGHRGAIFLVGLAVAGVNILGLLAFGIGVIFTGALSLLVWAAVYDELERAYAVEEVESWASP